MLGKTSLFRKYQMALTGLFLCLFLVGHLLGNLQLIFGAKESFNLYALFMTTNPVVKGLSYLTYLSVLYHIFLGIVLTFKNIRSRQLYYSKPKRSPSIWSSRNMGVLGTLVFIFLVTHMVHFWARMHFGVMPFQMVDGLKVKDLYSITVAFFTHKDLGLWASLLYALAMIPLAFHLLHGFKSAFLSLGILWKMRFLGYLFSIVVPLAFAIIPIYIHFFKA